MILWAHTLTLLWNLLACRTYEDLSAVCGTIPWHVPW